jgi:signal transduction histidine kinase
MRQAAHAGAIDQFAGHFELRRAQPLSRLLAPPQLWAVLAIAAASVFFVADVLVPRGATPAIGYALIPVVAGGTRKRSVILAMTAAAVVLTWAGYFLEPQGAAWWMSAFERLMISVVLGITLLLVLRRLTLLADLALRTEEMQQATNELSRSNEELDRFASVVAHDLRGPLNGIGLMAQLLIARRHEGMDPESQQWLASIPREVDNMSRLIERLLTYGHVGGGTVRLVPCDCGSVLSGVVGSLSAVLEANSAAVTHDPLPLVSADPVLLSALFQNLIENAIKYRGTPSPHVHVAARRQADEWVICVRDNGVGIAEADRAAIFRPFTQLGPAVPGSGVGLGLATCKRIVERHGGRIWVESAVGHGATFFFTLPAASTGVATS